MLEKLPVTQTRYIDPMVDAAFKRIFGHELHKDLLIAFLNEVFRGRKHIISLDFNKNEYPGDSVEEGGAVFDVTCTDENGNQFIIEVQRAKQKHFKQRALFYTSRLITSQAPKGKRSDWGYKLTEVYLIALLGDDLGGGPSNQYLHDVCLKDRDTDEIFYDELGYIFIELGRFVKTEEELETDLDRWLYLLKHLGQINEISPMFDQPVFQKLFNVAEYNNLTIKEKMVYDESLKRRWDNKNIHDYAVELAEDRGKKKGQEEAMLKTAIFMKAEGYSSEQIENVTSLSGTEIEPL